MLATGAAFIADQSTDAVRSSEIDRLSKENASKRGNWSEGTFAETDKSTKTRVNYMLESGEPLDDRARKSSGVQRSS